MNACASITRMTSATTSSRMAACWARRSRRGTGMMKGEGAPGPRQRGRRRRTRSAARTERQRHLAARAGGLVDAEDQLERLPAGAPVGVRRRPAAEDVEHVAVVSLVPEAIDVWWRRRRGVHELVVVVVLGEDPV